MLGILLDSDIAMADKNPFLREIYKLQDRNRQETYK